MYWRDQKLKLYQGFDLKVGKTTFLTLGLFHYEGDFPKLQGFCDEYLNFIPESNNFYKRYNKNIQSHIFWPNGCKIIIPQLLINYQLLQIS